MNKPPETGRPSTEALDKADCPCSFRREALRFKHGERLLLDGAMGSLLIARGLQLGECPEKVALDHPAWLEAIARSYREAGADLVQACTFGASPLKLAPYGLAGRTEEINRAAVEAARRGVDGQAGVYASIGPSGCILKPYGETSPEAVLESYRRQAAATAPLVDAVVVETMTDLREALLALQAFREVSDRPAWVTLTFTCTRRGVFTLMGNAVEAVVKELEAAGADAVGANCGNGSREMLPVAETFLRHTTLPVMIQPNAGLPRATAEGVVYPETPADMADAARQLLSLGVRILGGCCGSTPEHIRALREVLAEFRPAAVDGG